MPFFFWNKSYIRGGLVFYLIVKGLLMTVFKVIEESSFVQDNLLDLNPLQLMTIREVSKK